MRKVSGILVVLLILFSTGCTTFTQLKDSFSDYNPENPFDLEASNFHEVAEDFASFAESGETIVLGPLRVMDNYKMPRLYHARLSTGNSMRSYDPNTSIMINYSKVELLGSAMNLDAKERPNIWVKGVIKTNEFGGYVFEAIEVYAGDTKI